MRQFRAYTDPLNANQSSSLIPPSIPPPPPPPPPLNIPPSRARRQLAARLAMNKRNAAAAAAAGEDGAGGSSANGGGSDGEQGGHDDDEDAGFSVLKGLQAAPELSSSTGARPWELRDPFADDEDDDDDGVGGAGDGSGSDDGGDDGDVGTRSGGWNRGSWWRGVVRTAKRGGSKRGASGDAGRGSVERFGDGRDDSEESDEEREVDDDDVDDEEFGDFAMPEADGGRGSRSDAGIVTGIDPAREKVLLKPLPVHPAANKSGGSPFGSLWPFSTQAFGTGTKDKEKADDEEGEVVANTEGANAADGEKADTAPVISAEPLPLDADDAVVGEDGKKIDRAVEAKRRTSIEDPDEDDVVQESMVGRGGSTS